MRATLIAVLLVLGVCVMAIGAAAAASEPQTTDGIDRKSWRGHRISSSSSRDYRSSSVKVSSDPENSNAGYYKSDVYSTDFTKATRGEDGKDGKDGADGKPGKDGPVGPPGPDGQDGKDGRNGTDGGNGPTIRYVTTDFAKRVIKYDPATGRKHFMGQITAGARCARDFRAVSCDCDTNMDPPINTIDPDRGEYVRPVWFAATNSIKLVRNALISKDSTDKNTCACTAMYTATVSEPEVLETSAEGEETDEDSEEQGENDNTSKYGRTLLQEVDVARVYDVDAEDVEQATAGDKAPSKTAEFYDQDEDDDKTKGEKSGYYMKSEGDPYFKLKDGYKASAPPPYSKGTSTYSSPPLTSGDYSNDKDQPPTPKPSPPGYGPDNSSPPKPSKPPSPPTYAKPPHLSYTGGSKAENKYKENRGYKQPPSPPTYDKPSPHTYDGPSVPSYGDSHLEEGKDPEYMRHAKEPHPHYKKEHHREHKYKPHHKDHKHPRPLPRHPKYSAPGVHKDVYKLPAPYDDVSIVIDDNYPESDYDEYKDDSDDSYNDNSHDGHKDNNDSHNDKSDSYGKPRPSPPPPTARVDYPTPKARVDDPPPKHTYSSSGKDTYKKIRSVFSHDNDESNDDDTDYDGNDSYGSYGKASPPESYPPPSKHDNYPKAPGRYKPPPPPSNNPYPHGSYAKPTPPPSPKGYPSPETSGDNYPKDSDNYKPSPPPGKSIYESKSKQYKPALPPHLYKPIPTKKGYQKYDSDKDDYKPSAPPTKGYKPPAPKGYYKPEGDDKPNPYLEDDYNGSPAYGSGKSSDDDKYSYDKYSEHVKYVDKDGVGKYGKPSPKDDYPRNPHKGYAPEEGPSPPSDYYTGYSNPAPDGPTPDTAPPSEYEQPPPSNKYEKDEKTDMYDKDEKTNGQYKPPPSDYTPPPKDYTSDDYEDPEDDSSDSQHYPTGSEADHEFNPHHPHTKYNRPKKGGKPKAGGSPALDPKDSRYYTKGTKKHKGPKYGAHTEADTEEIEEETFMKIASVSAVDSKVGHRAIARTKTPLEQPTPAPTPAPTTQPPKQPQQSNLGAWGSPPQPEQQKPVQQKPLIDQHIAQQQQSATKAQQQRPKVVKHSQADWEFDYLTPDWPEEQTFQLSATVVCVQNAEAEGYSA